jgi:hypothetical protein
MFPCSGGEGVSCCVGEGNPTGDGAVAAAAAPITASAARATGQPSWSIAGRVAERGSSFTGAKVMSLKRAK